MKGKFDQQCKIYTNKTLVSEHLEKQQLLDKKLIYHELKFIDEIALKTVSPSIK